MELFIVEREAITDSVLKIQSVQRSLDHVEETKVPDLRQIYECLRAAHSRLHEILRAGRVPTKA